MARPQRTAFLMHGILNNRFSMLRLEKGLARAGFGVVNLDYPSRSKTVEEHADWLAEKVKEHGRGDLYFVGHSLGAIVIRCFLGRRRLPRARRFVMIAPPNSGSVAADLIRRKTPVYRLIWGDQAGSQLCASRKDFWKRLPRPAVEFGIIAGGRGDGKGINPLIPGDNDGTVGVSEARLKGAKDFLLLPYQHTSIILRGATVEAAVRFLVTGRFRGADAA